MKFFIQAWSLLIVGLFLFCSKQDQSGTNEINELKFEVDSTKLEIRTRNTDLGIQFNSPKDWMPISHELLEDFSKRNASEYLKASGFVWKPISIFLNKKNESLLYISLVQGQDDTSSITMYKDLIQKNIASAKAGDFIKDGIHFSQILVQDNERVNFKLLFFNSKNQLIQFDYVIPNQFYISELKAIESSIGSIQFTD